LIFLYFKKSIIEEVHNLFGCHKTPRYFPIKRLCDEHSSLCEQMGF
jgi:hypothetical protein